jgi:hypothetical protein
VEKSRFSNMAAEALFKYADKPAIRLTVKNLPCNCIFIDAVHAENLVHRVERQEMADSRDWFCPTQSICACTEQSVIHIDTLMGLF